MDMYGIGYSPEGLGVCLFAFNFYPISDSDTWKYHYNKGMEPYKCSWTGDKISFIKVLHIPVIQAADFIVLQLFS